MPRKDTGTKRKARNADVNQNKRLREDKSQTRKDNCKSNEATVKTEMGKVIQNGIQTSKKCWKFVGAHVSISGGMYKAVEEAVELGAKSFAMFLKSQRQWNSKPLEDKVAERFRESCKEHNFSPRHIVPHGSYLMNCGSPKEETRLKSHNMLVDELQRCEKLGLTLFNFHPGSTLGEISVDECLDFIAEAINNAHGKTKYTSAVLENMCCQGNTVGGKFSELRGIIDRVTDKSRVGVCLDTCHAFAAGYDLSSVKGYNAMMTEIEDVIGLQYLKAVHINDSKGEVGCHLDRHEIIGKGKIGKAAFVRIMNDDRFNDIPFILETPQKNENDDYSKEIKLLNGMIV